MADRPDGVLRQIMRRFGLAPHSDRRWNEDALRSLADAQRASAAALHAKLTDIGNLVAQRSTAKDATEILRAIRALARASERSLGRTSRQKSDGEISRAEVKLYRELDALAQSQQPIIVGPWTGEVGFELLYWAPFVAWFRSRWRVPPERFVIISRGGTESWYGMAGARYVDIFSVVTPAVFRARTDLDQHKQREISDFDREIVAGVTSRLQLDAADQLHPRLMYRALRRFWQDEAGFGAIDRFTLHRRLDSGDDAVLATLPAEYVAVRFYFSDCFPETPVNRAVAHSIIGAISSRIPVVLLNPGLRLDDHSDYARDASEGMILLPSDLPPERNLAVQSAIISRARGFVGTYGGFSYLAPFHGVPATAFYSAPVFKLHHLHVAQRIFERLGSATVVAIDIAQRGLVAAATADAVSVEVSGRGARI